MSSVANDQPDWTEQVTNAANARLIGKTSLASGTSTTNAALLATDRQVVVIATGGAAITITSADGNNTGIDWSQFDNIGAGDNIAGRPVVIPVWGSVDTSIAVTLNSASAYVYWVIASPDEFIQGSPSVPVAVRQQPTVASSAGATTQNNTVAILGAPAAGFGYDLKLLTMFSSAAFTAATSARIQGHTSGLAYLAQDGAVGSLVAQHEAPSGLVITEGLDAISGASGANTNCAVFYDLVQLPF